MTSPYETFAAGMATQLAQLTRDLESQAANHVADAHRALTAGSGQLAAVSYEAAHGAHRAASQVKATTDRLVQDFLVAKSADETAAHGGTGIVAQSDDKESRTVWEEDRIWGDFGGSWGGIR